MTSDGRRRPPRPGPGANLISEGELTEQLSGLPDGRRSLVALAGPPGSGKTTIAGSAVDALNQARPDRAAFLQMDGYHLGNQILKEKGRLGRKGAPDTFDVSGLAHMLGRLRDPGTDDVFIPIFDRNLDTACAGSAAIPASVDIVIVEGNYLLVNQEPWRQLNGCFDLKILISAPETLWVSRLENRWKSIGISSPEAADKIKNNDIPNGRYVMEHSVGADFTLSHRAHCGTKESRA